MKFTYGHSSVAGTAGLAIVLMTTLLVLVSGQDSSGQTTQANSTTTRNNRRRNNRRRGNNNRGGRRGGRDRYARYGCEEIYLPMCKGLVSYTHTKLPNRFNHTTQLDVYRSMEHLWAYMDHSCSKNTRLMICSTYLPKCHGRRPGMGPCKQTCLRAKKACARPLNELMSLNWREQFPCRGLPNRRCVRPVRDRTCPYQHTSCVNNTVFPICNDLTFTYGTMPNMFSQCHVQEINTEVAQYDRLIATNCHLNLKFLLCGVYSPFCVRAEQPFTLPCRELCEEVREACESHYQRLYNGLPWPQKLQCHRYPASDDENMECVMPNEGSTFFGG